MIVGWSDIPDGIARPIIARTLKSVRRLDLTGDRPLTRSEARKLKRWWESNGWSVDLIKLRKFYSVIASKIIYI